MLDNNTVMLFGYALILFGYAVWTIMAIFGIIVYLWINKLQKKGVIETKKYIYTCKEKGKDAR